MILPSSYGRIDFTNLRTNELSLLRQHSDPFWTGTIVRRMLDQAFVHRNAQAVSDEAIQKLRALAEISFSGRTLSEALSGVRDRRRDDFDNVIV